jgi:transcriptional regulator with XRE-family HTH domain
MVRETLAEYLKRVMHERNMKVADLQAASGLSQTYINRLLKGTQTNLTIETIAVLSQALNVDGFELFAAAYGKAPEKTNVDLLVLADTINKIILNPMLVELVQNTAKLKSKHQQAVLDTARSLAKKDKTNKKNHK